MSCLIYNFLEVIVLKSNLRILRAKMNISQTTLSKATNISRQTISLLEKGEYIPSLKTAKKLSLYFEEPIDDIFILEEEDLI